ncbi:MAG: restriction endonuclease subunit S [Helicobacteraceae bacterium]|jgi:type I restriction enzyme S subunit|nr:restriction endonuclease subunit S [Helicobacteraceae bacterium]
MSEWKRCQLSEFIQFKNGKKRPIKFGSTPVYGGNGILDYTDTANNENSVIIGRVGAYCGSVYYESNQHWVSDNAISAVNKDNSDIIFDYYLLKNLDLNYRHIGTSQPLLTQEILNTIEVALPSLVEQRAIAAILSALDDKIELNNRINANLEAQAQAIFKSWFQTPESSKWKHGFLSDMVEINPPRKVKNETLLTYLEMAKLSISGPFPLGWTKRIFSGGMKFANGDTLLARITPCLENGKAAFVNFLDKGGTGFGSTEYIVLSSKEGYPAEMTYLFARDKDFIDYAVKNMSGTTGRQRVSAEMIGKYQTPIPPENFVSSYSDIFATYFERIRNNSFESRALAVIRDTLLPKLMSGELRVQDIDDHATNYLETKEQKRETGK